jgi:NAD(P)-dependent dehydrogenase (short-subunit alcohol dehydrogenase family)
MVDRGHGRIVNITSFAGEDPLPGSMGYSVSKAGARAFSRALAVELAGRLPGIVVTEWAPDMMATHIGRPDGADPDDVARLGLALVLNHDPRLHGATFLRDHQVLPRRSIRQRLKDLLLLKPACRPIVVIPDGADPEATT